MTRNTGHDNKLHPGPVHPRPYFSKFSGSLSKNKKKLRLLCLVENSSVDDSEGSKQTKTTSMQIFMEIWKHNSRV